MQTRLSTGSSFRPQSLSSVVSRLTKLLERPSLDAAFSREERDIVKREYDLRVLEDPYADIANEMRKTKFADTQYARSVIGTPESIAAMTVDDALTLFDQTHRPENAIVVIYGNLKEAQVVRAFGGGHLAHTSTQPTPFPPLPFAALNDTKAIKAPIATPTLMYQKLVKRPDCGAYDHCDAALNILSDALDSGLAGGLAGPLRFDNFFARSFSTGLYHVGEDGLFFYFNAEADAGVTPEQVHIALAEALSAVASDGLPRDTIEKVKDRGLTDFDADLDQAQTMRDVLIASASIRREPHDLAYGRAALAGATHDMTQILFDALVGEGRTVVRYLTPE